MSIDYSSVETVDEIPDETHAYNEFFPDRFCSKAGRACNCGHRPAVSAATSVYFKAYLSRKASIARRS